MPDRHVLLHAYGHDTTALATALRVARQAGAELGPGSRFHVVVQGPLVRLLAPGGPLSEEIVATASDAVQVVACRNSMRGAGMTDDELLAPVGIVPSAAAYLAERQWAGWAYLRY